MHLERLLGLYAVLLFLRTPSPTPTYLAATVAAATTDTTTAPSAAVTAAAAAAAAVAAAPQPKPTARRGPVHGDHGCGHLCSQRGPVRGDLLPWLCATGLLRLCLRLLQSAAVASQ